MSRRHDRLTLAASVLLSHAILVNAQSSTELVVLDGINLARGLDVGVDSSEGVRNWLTPDGDKLKMAYPSGQAWGVVFITVGQPKDPPRPSMDVSSYLTLSVEMRGEANKTVSIGIKDNTQADNGRETKFIVPFYGDWRTYTFPLVKFQGADAKRLYVITEFVFEGATPHTVFVRNIRLTRSVSPDVSGLVNGASFRDAVSARSWITVAGTDLSSVTRTWENADFAGTRLPFTLSGIGLVLGDRQLPIYYISSNQINALLPSDIPSGRTYVAVRHAGGISIPYPVTIVDRAPAMFTFAADSTQHPAAVHLDGVLVGRPGLLGSTVPTRPARPGDIIQFFATALGPTTPEASHEEILASPAPLASSNAVRLRIANQPAIVRFAGLISPGLYQMNAEIPNVADGTQPLALELDGVLSLQSLSLTVQR